MTMYTSPADQALESLITMRDKGIAVEVSDIQRTASWFGADYGTLLTRFNASRTHRDNGPDLHEPALWPKTEAEEFEEQRLYGDAQH